MARFPLLSEHLEFDRIDMIYPPREAEHTGIPPIVLVVEDDRDNRDMYEALLNAEGFWVMKVGDPVEAFEYAKDFHPDAVLTDLGRSGESDGAELIRELRADPEFEFTPIIAVTGRQPSDFQTLKELEVSAVLLKPVSPDTLVERLNSALQDSALLRARSRALLERIPVLLQRSQAVLQRSSDAARAMLEARQRECPACGEPLVWVESSRVQQVSYDHYEWCARGCGLFCFNRSTGTFEQLAAGNRIPEHGPDSSSED
jgi:two-component system chemotaxis response regulator CheY